MNEIWNQEAINEILNLVHVNSDGATTSVHSPYLLGLYLQNFQSIGYPGVSIPLQALTFQYGQNSSGKSAVADAMTLLKSICGRKPDKSAEQLLSRWASDHRSRYVSDIEKIIKISATTFMTEDTFSSWGEDTRNEWIDAWFRPECWEIFGKNGPIDRSQFFQIDFEFQGQSEEDRYGIFLSKVTLKTLDGEIAAFNNEMREYEIRHSLKFHYKHPIFHKETFSENYDFIPEKLIDRSSKDGGNAEFVRKGLLEIYADRAKDNGYSVIVNEVEFSHANMNDPACFWSRNVSFIDEGCQNKNFAQIACFLDFIFGATAYAIRDAAKNMLVPPIRPVLSSDQTCFRVSAGNKSWVYYRPDDLWKLIAEASEDELSYGEMNIEEWLRKNLSENYNISPRSEIQRASEKDPFQNIGEKLIEYVNKILFLPQFLDTGYALKTTIQERHIEESKIKEILDWAENKQVDKIKNALRYAERDVIVHLRDRNGKDVHIEDVGTGISQAIPILVACFFARQLHVQQPELHLHPKLQAQMADVFIERINAVKTDGQPRHFLIETHSEHLLLRVLRRIRETSRADIPSQFFSLRPEQVAVLYFDQNDLGETTVKHIRINKDGEFIDRWPKGFFTEREAELFDEDE